MRPYLSHPPRQARPIFRLTAQEGLFFAGLDKRGHHWQCGVLPPVIVLRPSPRSSPQVFTPINTGVLDLSLHPPKQTHPVVGFPYAPTPLLLFPSVLPSPNNPATTLQPHPRRSHPHPRCS